MTDALPPELLRIPPLIPPRSQYGRTCHCGVLLYPYGFWSNGRDLLIRLGFADVYATDTAAVAAWLQEWPAPHDVLGPDGLCWATGLCQREEPTHD